VTNAHANKHNYTTSSIIITSTTRKLSLEANKKSQIRKKTIPVFTGYVSVLIYNRLKI